MPVQNNDIIISDLPIELGAVRSLDEVDHDSSSDENHNAPADDKHSTGEVDPDEKRDVYELTTGSAVDVNADTASEDHIIVSGEDAATYLLPMRDDHDPAITFRSLFLATGLAAFQAVMFQIYSVSLPSAVC